MSNGGDHLLCRTLRGESVERAPVWALRQTGRWDPEFVALRNTRDSMDRLEWSTKASLLPRRFGVDAIVPLFDFTALTTAMGMVFVQRPDFGPMPEKPLRTRDDVTNVAAQPDEDRFRPVTDLLRALQRELNGALPILAIADAPFTLGAYCLGLSKELEMLRIFVREHADAWALLLDRLTEAATAFVKMLVAAGADVLQLSDSLAGKLTEDEYDRWALRSHKAVLAAVGDTPSILYVKEGAYLDAMSACGADAVSLGVNHDLAQLRRRFPQMTLQGNVNAELLRSGTPDEIIHVTQACLKHGGGQRHILNVDRGLAHDTKPENFAAFVATARSFRV